MPKTVNSKPAFERCHPITAKWEGGWSDHSADPGGKTMYGITEGTWRAYCAQTGRAWKPVRRITRAEAEAVYMRNYWQPVVGKYNLRPGVDLATYDAAVNSGPGRAIKWLIRASGGPDQQTVEKLCDIRLSFVRSLRTWKHFGRGWSRRIADIRAKGVAMALEAAPADHDAAEQLAHRRGQEQKAKKRKEQGAAGAGGAGCSPAGIEQVAGTPLADWLVLGALGIGTAVAVYFWWRSRHHKDAAQAFDKEASA